MFLERMTITMIALFFYGFSWELRGQWPCSIRAVGKSENPEGGGCSNEVGTCFRYG